MSDAQPLEPAELIIPGAGAPDGQSSSEPRARTRDGVRTGQGLRVGSMIKQLLDEVRSTPLDEPSRERLKVIFERSVDELGLRALTRSA